MRLLILLVLFGCAHQLPKRVATKDVSFSKENETCPADKSPLTPISNKVPGAYTIHRDGAVEVPEDDFDVDQIAFVFPDLEADDVVRVDKGDTTLACGSLTRSVETTQYVLPNAVGRDSLVDSLVVVSIYGRAKPREQDLARAKTALLASLERVERDELRRSLDELEAANAAVHDLFLHPSITTLDTAMTSIADANNATQRGHDCEPSTWTANPLAELRCRERHELRTDLEKLYMELRASRPAWIPFVQGSRALDASIVELSRKVEVKPTLTLDEQEAHCKGVAQLRWLFDPANPRLIARNQIPYFSRRNLLVASYGESVDVVNVPASSKLAVLLLGAPVSTPGSFAKKQGNLVSTDIAGLIATVLPSVLKQLPSAPISLLDSSELDKLNASRIDADEHLVPLSYACREETKVEPARPADKPLAVRAIAPSVDPIARKESRVFVFGPTGKKYATEIVACEGTSCTANGDDKNVRSRVSITPTQRGRMALLGELAVGYGLATRGDVGESAETNGFRPQTAPKFQPVGGGGGPDQLFELQQSFEPRNAITTSLLLGVRITDRWFLGAGPSLFVGSSGSALSQWSLHAGFRPAWIPGMYATFGASARFVATPDNYDIGDVVAVPIPASGMAVAPALSTHQTALFQFDVGLAFDLGAAASSASSLVSSLGGGK